MPCACAEEFCRSGSISKSHQLTNLNKCGKFHSCIRNSTILALSRLAICSSLMGNYYMGLDAKKNCLLGFGNNKDKDQPAPLGNLTSAFGIRLLESIISRLATSEISMS